MIDQKKQLIVSLSKEEELKIYQQGVLGVLSTIELNDCDEVLMSHIKTTYRLLHYLNRQSVSLNS
ncbi:hypothetical protein [Aquimarina sediminis]|uniref:hypothetical protein n=1 Tax=Aquimarina sediminis TaxID=2070536 RepID=UPI000CA02304|nr:hypothetical protein [Aquimarina sediminis]